MKGLNDVLPEQVFWFKDGRSAKNLVELAGALEKISDDIFFHHVNSEKNDFCNWIEFSVKDSVLAKRLKPVKDKDKTIKIIEKRISELQKFKKGILGNKPVKIKKTSKRIKSKSVQKKASKLKKIEKNKKTRKQKKASKRVKKIKKRPGKKPVENEQIRKQELFVQDIIHHSTSEMISHIALGIVIGAAIMMLILFFV